MILADSSAWIDHLQDRRTRAAVRLYGLFGDPALATTDTVHMEVMAGVRGEQEHRTIVRLLAATVRIPTEADDFDDAAAIYRACRRQGATPRSLLDCLIAAVARRVDAAVLHADRDFDLIAEQVDLRIDR